MNKLKNLDLYFEESEKNICMTPPDLDNSIVAAAVAACSSGTGNHAALNKVANRGNDNREGMGKEARKQRSNVTSGICTGLSRLLFRGKKSITTGSLKQPISSSQNDNGNSVPVNGKIASGHNSRSSPDRDLPVELSV